MFNKLIILGASGRIGTGLCNAANAHNIALAPISRSVYQNWDDPDQVKEYFESIHLGKGDLVICASGLINPKQDETDIRRANFIIPKNTCQVASSMGAQAVTLGTILEKIMPNGDQNPYVRSKLELAAEASGQWLHLQLHTIYGGRAPDSFMFVGQMLEALKNNKRFSMTSGDQVREYHHVEDTAQAILTMASQLETSCVDISHGEYVSLRDLATEVFTHFKKTELLGIGDLQSPKIEAYQPNSAKHALLQNQNFRDTLPNVLKWLEAHV